MKINIKIALIYTVITTLILILFSSSVYFLIMQDYSENMFNKLIKERAIIAAEMYLKKDEMSQSAYNQIERTFLEPLANENIEIYDSLNNLNFINITKKHEFSNVQINEIRKNREMTFKIGKRQCYGLCLNDNQGEFVICISAYDSYGKSKIDLLQIILVLGTFISIIFVILVGNFLSKFFLRPFNAIIKEVNKIRATNLHRRLTVKGKDELANLARTFNLMLDRLEGSFQMQKIFINNASHELKNPITAILGMFEIALHFKRTENEYINTIKKAYEETERIDYLINGLLNLAQENFDSVQMQADIRIDELLFEIISKIKQKNQNTQINLNFDTTNENTDFLSLNGNVSLLTTVFNNLFENACKYSNYQPVECIISTYKNLSITISDKGIGIPQTDLENIFNPFFRSENARSFKGAGLGLALVEKIVKFHNGTISVQSKLNEGTTFKIEFLKNETCCV